MKAFFVQIMTPRSLKDGNDRAAQTLSIPSISLVTSKYWNVWVLLSCFNVFVFPCRANLTIMSKCKPCSNFRVNLTLVFIRDVLKYRYRYRLISVKILGIGIGLFQPIPNWYRFKNTIKINIY